MGGIIGVDANVVPDARAKMRNAMAAYGPLAMKIFGSPRIAADLKFRFLWALVMTRLMFNIHIVVPTPKYIAIINGVYMRGLRRIRNMCRYGHAATDLAVRQSLKMPSIDWLFTRARLRYMARILKNEPVTLAALLAARPSGEPMPWTALILKDMDTIRAFGVIVF